MALINRVSRLFKADFNAVLDQIEEPEQLLKQAVRDMEDELLAAEQRIAGRVHEQDVISKRIREIVSSIEDADEQLDLCFESDKDDLARGLIRRKLEAERLTRRLQSRFDANAATLETEGKQLAENRRTLEGLRQKADVFVHRPCPAGNLDESAWLAREMNVSDDEVEIAFLREQSARSGS
jgi:phage shock protein A